MVESSLSSEHGRLGNAVRHFLRAGDSRSRASYPPPPPRPPGLPERSDQARPEVARAASLSTRGRVPTDGLRTIFWQGQEVTYEVIDGYAVHDGDIILGRADEIESGLAVLPGHGSHGLVRRRDAYSVVSMSQWPGGLIPYVFQDGATELQREKALAVMAEFNARTAVTFVPRRGQDLFLELRRGCCMASLGAQLVGPTYARTLNGPLSTIAHELLHVVGFLHEHQRPDREEWAMFGSSTYSDNNNQRMKLPTRPFLGLGIDTPFDYQSNVSYGTGNDSIPPGMSTHDVSLLSAGDIAGINQLYGEPSQPTTITTNPPGLELVVDGHRVRTPAVFHWVSGSSHVIEAPLWQEGGMATNSINATYLEVGLAGTRQLFGRWNDGGKRVHRITAGSERPWIEASFINQRRSRPVSNYETILNYELGTQSETLVELVEDLFEGLNATPRALTFISDHYAGGLGAQLIRLTNRSNSSQRYTVAVDRPWLMAKPTEVSLKPGASADIEVRVARGDLQAEIHAASLRVRPEGSSRRLRAIPVAFVVLPELAAVRLGKRGGTLDLAYSATEGFVGRDGRPVTKDGRVVSAQGDTYVLTRSLSGITATFEPQTQTLDLPRGEQVTLVQRGEGDWYIGEDPVQNGYRHIVGGHEYMLELVGGQWRPAPYAVRIAAGPDPGPAFATSLTMPQWVAVDAAGNVFVTDQTGVLKIGQGGEATWLIGGPGSRMPMRPGGVAVGRGGEVYVSHSDGNRVVKIDTTGRVRTVAGTGAEGYGGDGGLATEAQLNHPRGLALDAAGNLYIGDSGSGRVRKIDIEGRIATVAGIGEAGYDGDGGPATEARLSVPNAVAVDLVGNVYVTDAVDGVLRRIDTTGTISTLASLSDLDGVAVDAAGNVYVTRSTQHRVSRIDATGEVRTFAGSWRGFGGDGGPATYAQLSFPRGVTVDANGNVYIAEAGNDRVRKVTTDGTITTLVGSGGYGGRIYPSSLAVDAAGNAYMTGVTGNSRNSDLPEDASVLKVEPDGTLTTIAGTHYPGFSGDGGPAIEALLSSPEKVAVDSRGNLYVSSAFYSNSRVRRIDAAGTITTFAGQGGHSSSCANVGDLAIDLDGASLVSVDGKDNVFVGNSSHCLARIDAGGVIGSIMRDDAVFSSDHRGTLPWWRGYFARVGVPFDFRGAADIASATRISGVDADAVGNVYFSVARDPYSSGKSWVYQVRETGNAIKLAEIPANIEAIAVGGDGQFYAATIGDRSRIWRLDTRSGLVEVIAGNGEPWFSSGSRVDAMAVAPNGNLWFAQDGRVTVLESLPLPPEVTVRLPGGGEVILNKRQGDSVWRIGDTPVQEGHRYVLGDTEYVLARRAGQWTAVSVRVPLGASGERAEIKVLADGSLLHEPTGRTMADGSVLTGTDFDDYRLVVGSGDIRAVPAPQQQQVKLPGGRRVNVVRGTNGDWQYRGLPLESGGSLVVDGRRYPLERVQGRWQTTPGNGFYSLRTVVGSTPTAIEGIPATDATLFRPSGIAVDAVGNVFIADTGNRRIRKVDVAGRIWNVAGTGVRGSGGDGEVAARAQLESPGDLALDGRGNLFFLDDIDFVSYQALVRNSFTGASNGLRPTWYVLRMIDSAKGALRTLATPVASLIEADSVGNLFLVAPYFGNSSAAIYRRDLGDDNWEFLETDRLHYPFDIALGSNRNDLYLSLGCCGKGYVAKLSLTTGTLNVVTKDIDAHSVAVDRAGKVYVAGGHNGELGVFRINPATGAVEKQSLFPPAEDLGRVAVDRVGNVYVTQPKSHRVSRINAATWEATRFAGTDDSTAGWRGGPAESARLEAPSAIAVDAGGTLYYVDANRIWKVDTTGIVTVLAGTGEAGDGGDGGPAIKAQLNSPSGLAVDAARNIYVADTGNHRVRRINVAGIITTVAGTGEKGNGGDGRASEIPLWKPHSLTINALGNLMFVESSASAPDYMRRIRTIDNRGTITTFAEEIRTRPNTELDLSVDRGGNVFFVEKGNFRVYKIDAVTRTRELVGNSYPVMALAADRSGDLYVAGSLGYDGPLHEVGGLAYLGGQSEVGSTVRVRGPDGFFKGDEGNNGVLRIAGNGKSGFSGDAVLAIDAAMSVSDMVVDRRGNIWFADPWARRIRVLER